MFWVLTVGESSMRARLVDANNGYRVYTREEGGWDMNEGWAENWELTTHVLAVRKTPP